MGADDFGVHARTMLGSIYASTLLTGLFTIIKLVERISNVDI